MLVCKNVREERRPGETSVIEELAHIKSIKKGGTLRTEEGTWGITLVHNEFEEEMDK